MRKAARLHFTGEISRNIYRLQGARALVGMMPDEPESPEVYESRLKESLGSEWACFKPLQERLNNPGTVHSHLMASVTAAGLYVEEQSRFYNSSRNVEAFNTLFEGGSRHDVLDVLKAAGVTTTEQLVDFYKGSLTKISAPLESLYAETVKFENKPVSAPKDGMP